MTDFDIVRRHLGVDPEGNGEAALDRIEARLRERTHRLHACQDENERLRGIEAVISRKQMEMLTRSGELLNLQDENARLRGVLKRIASDNDMCAEDDYIGLIARTALKEEE